MCYFRDIFKSVFTNIDYFKVCVGAGRRVKNPNLSMKGIFFCRGQKITKFDSFMFIVNN